MPTTNFDCSMITKRRQNRAAAGTFINRIQNTTNPSLGYGNPNTGNYNGSVIPEVKSGHTTQYIKNNTCEIISQGCPCGTNTIVNETINIDPGWVSSILNGGQNSVKNSVAVDNQGNSFFTGYFDTTPITFNNFIAHPTIPGDFVNITSYGQISKVGADDLYLVKYNSTGQVQWATTIENSGSGLSNTGVICDNNGDVYIVGYSTNSSSVTINNFDSAPNTPGGTINLVSYGIFSNTTGQISYIVKYNGITGQVIWATNTGTCSIQQATKIGVDSSNNVYISGIFFTSTAVTVLLNSFLSPPTIPGGTINVTPYGTLSNTDASANGFIIKYNNTGQVQWATKIGVGPNMNDLIVGNNGFIYATGSYSGTCNFYNFNSAPVTPGAAIGVSSYGTLSPSGSSDSFLVKYNSSTGQVVWAVSTTGSSSVFKAAEAIAIDSSDNIYNIGTSQPTTLSFNNFVSAPGTAGGSINITASGTIVANGCAYLIKYNSIGQVQWATVLDGSTLFNGGRDIAIDSQGNPCIVGQYQASPLFLNSFQSLPLVPGGTITLSPYGRLVRIGNSDSFLVKFTPTGQIIWATRIAGSAFERGNAITINSDDSIITSGYYDTSTLVNPFMVYSFSSAPNTPTSNVNLVEYGKLTSLGTGDTYIVKYNSDGVVQQ